MHVGIPTEIKNNEYRVAITPAGVAELIKHGHEVLIQAGAGEGSAIADNDFKAAGAQIVEGGRIARGGKRVVAGSAKQFRGGMAHAAGAPRDQNRTGAPVVG